VSALVDKNKHHRTQDAATKLWWKHTDQILRMCKPLMVPLQRQAQKPQGTSTHGLTQFDAHWDKRQPGKWRMPFVACLSQLKNTPQDESFI